MIYSWASCCFAFVFGTFNTPLAIKNKILSFKEEILLKSLNISIDTIEKVRIFNSIVSALKGDCDLISGRYTVDAKSIMGIYSLDISHPLRLDIHNDAEYDEAVVALKDFTI